MLVTRNSCAVARMLKLPIGQESKRGRHRRLVSVSAAGPSTKLLFKSRKSSPKHHLLGPTVSVENRSRRRGNEKLN
ncbi:unnamed protein product [Soboliphyme baturini]|uniref:Uncharacterized protein n=1 Tax=Soboliphyme baturini TaxID=241478 RepID=A0A183J5P1_9BILA|nr:unnamed protein product [Soboliphyme baturini]